MVVDALETKFYANLIGYINFIFHELVAKMKLFEKSFNKGKMRDSTVTNSIMKKIHTRTVSKMMRRKNEKDVSLIFPRMGSAKKIWNTKATKNARGTISKPSGGNPTYTKTRVRNQKFTSLGNFYENILNILK